MRSAAPLDVDTVAREVGVKLTHVEVSMGIGGVARARGPGQAGAMRRQVEKCDLVPAWRRYQSSRRNQLTHGFVEPHNLLLDHPCERQTSEGFGYRRDGEDRIG